MKIVEILTVEEENQLEKDNKTVSKYVVGRVSDFSCIKSLLKEIGKIFGRYQLKHLQKIRKSKNENCLQVYLKGKFQIDVELLPICITPPLTFNQLEIWSRKFWPIQMRVVDKRVNAKFIEYNKLSRFSCRSLSLIHKYSRAALVGNVITITSGLEQEDSSLTHPLSVPCFQENHANEHPLNHSILQICGHGKNLSTESYLLTNRFVFLPSEPCTMCSMALLHSRVKSVFILNTQKNGGFSKYRIHCCKRLNHRFEVFSVKLA
eukprot:snap_masked-scaffold_2-processed-gene-7.52-mRNA-1 protein AED:0.40 eAED:0.40 QI:0/0/0/0.5/1/1/2/0/262